LNCEFDFDLDVCATPDNAKRERFANIILREALPVRASISVMYRQYESMGLGTEKTLARWEAHLRAKAEARETRQYNTRDAPNYPKDERT
jgi:hypothetical protein